jgi:hypothetical protein
MAVICVKMAVMHLKFLQRKWILKCCWQRKNATEAQKRWRNESGTPPPARATVTKICDKFEVNGKVLCVNSV